MISGCVSNQLRTELNAIQVHFLMLDASLRRCLGHLQVSIELQYGLRRLTRGKHGGFNGALS